MVVLNSGSGGSKKTKITLKPGTVTNPFNPTPTYGHQVPAIQQKSILPTREQLYKDVAGMGVQTSSPQVKTTSTGVIGNGGDVGYQSLINSNNALVDAWLQKQMSTIDQQKVASLADLEKSLNSAIAQGDIDSKEAGRIYDENKTKIEQNAYQMAQLTAINGQKAGIQDSAQMLALQQGDNARMQNAVTANNTDRSSRLSAIQDRIAKFKNDYNTDVNTVNQTYNNALLGAQGEAGQMRNQFNLDMQKSAFENAQSRSNMAYQSALEKSMYDYKAQQEANQNNLYNPEIANIIQQVLGSSKKK